MTFLGTPYTELKRKYQNILSRTTWFHGTTKDQLESLGKGVKVNFNKNGELDFGYGFYLAPDFEMASSFIKRMTLNKIDTGFAFSEDELTPVIIEYEFQLPPESFFKDPSYKTTCFPKYSTDFAEFILKNRLNKGKKNHDFDLIYGVMSDGNPATLVPEVIAGEKTEDEFVQEIVKFPISTRQLSVHNQEICDMLVLKDVHYLEGVVKHVEYSGHGQQ